MNAGFDFHDRIDSQYGEDSYIAQTFDDSPTYGADFVPEDADSVEYAEECSYEYMELDEDYGDEYRYPGYPDGVIQA